jgi:hypothetical protein
VIGGGVADAGELLLAPARQAYAERLTAHGVPPHAEIRLAQLGNQAGLVGAADLAAPLTRRRQRSGPPGPTPAGLPVRPNGPIGPWCADEAITHSARHDLDPLLRRPTVAPPRRARRPPPPARAAAVPCSSIEVTTRGSGAHPAQLHRLRRHLWEKDGQTADRAELLDGVKLYLEQPRIPTKRRSSKRS